MAIIRNVNEKTLDKKSKFWYYFLVHIGSSYFSVIVYLKSKKYKKVIDKYKIFWYNMQVMIFLDSSVGRANGC